LKRATQREIENPLALRLIEGAFTDGEAILVDVDDEGRFVFNKAQNRVPVAS
jgi:ATP-dependent Clp protease ATP-binding subunit ClpB